MPFLVVALVIQWFRLPVFASRNAGFIALPAQVFAEGVAVIPEIAQDDAIPVPGEKLLGLGDIVDLPGGKEQSHGPASPIDQCVELGIASALCDSKCLVFSAANGICTSLKHFDMGCINDAQFAAGSLCHEAQSTIPNLELTPEQKTPMNRLPGSETFRKVPPGATRSDPIKERLQNKLDRARRAPDLRRIPVNVLQPLRSIFLSAAALAATNGNGN